MEELSKRERQDLAKEQRESERIAQERKSQLKRMSVWFFSFVVLGALGFWAFKAFTAPLPGQLFPDLGREHVNDIGAVEYNSNPPTSGTHFPVWAKKGIYDRILSDGYLIHSLEHGYVVISYDCTKQLTVHRSSFIDVFAQETVDEPVDVPVSTESGKPLTKMTVFPTDKMSWVTPDTKPGIEVPLPSEFNSSECQALVKDLSQFLSDWDRVVIVPRLGMDHPIALTAWRRLLELDSVDKGKIEEFIEMFHNMGPEKTME
jgi:hypothetical protein